MKSVSIPVLTFHSIRPAELPWFWSHLSCPPSLFEAYLKYLKANRYRTVLLTDIVDCMDGRKELPKRSVALTFDDGYLDNWTVAVPLLKKYGFCGTIFVNPDFVDSRDVIREQVCNGDWTMMSREQVDGFMSWSELCEAQYMGALDVQSHGMTHTWYPSSDEIVDFHHPGDRYPWLAWNARPERKYLWPAEDQSDSVELGVPIYAHGKSLIVRRYFEPKQVSERLTEFVKQNGGVEFFQKPDWRAILHAEASKLEVTGRYESEDEYKARVLWELQTSCEEISSRLGKPVEIIAWPGGGYNDVTVEAARQAGYIGWDIQDTQSPGIPRISVPVLNLGTAINRLIFIYKVETSRGAASWRLVQWLIKHLNLASILLKRQAGNIGSRRGK